MRTLLLPLLLLLVFAFSACKDTGPEGPVAFTPLYQGALDGVPTVVVHASNFNGSDNAHWQHLEEYGEWSVKRILGTGSAGIAYIVNSDQVPAPSGSSLPTEFKQHTIASIQWLPSQEAKLSRDPFNTQAEY